MISLEEAREFVLSVASRREPAVVPVADALGLVLASDIVSAVSIPPFANTAMDGFAIKASDVVDAPISLHIAGTIAAGQAPSHVLQPGEAMRIMTGAVVPDGADAIVMVELTSVDHDNADTVLVSEAVPVGNHIRGIGDDVNPGDLLFSAGDVLGAGHLGVLCSLGLIEVSAYPRLRIGVISTGDELVDDGSPLEAGQIRDSNRRTVLSLITSVGAEAVDLGLARDDEDVIEAAMRSGVAECDAVMTTGGVSMGDFDYVKAVLRRIGDMRWMQIAIKPAKPFAFGTVDGVPVFGFPGNPVSCMVSFELFGRPAIRQMMGHETPIIATESAIADSSLGRGPDGKTHFVRVAGARDRKGQMHVRSSGGQGSHMLWAMSQATALAVVPDGDGIEAGGDVEVIVLG